MKLKLIDSRTIPSSDESFWTKVRNGELVKVHGTFYANAYRWKRLRLWEREMMHATAVGLGARTAVLVGRSAAAIWQLPIIHRNEPFVAELMYPKHRRPGGKQKQQRDLYFRIGYLAEGEIVEKAGVRVTSLQRTAIDVARFENFPHALMIVEGCLREYPKTFAKAKDAIRSGPPAKGMTQARKVFKTASAKSESPAESLTLGHLHVSGICSEHDTLQNHSINVEGRTYRPDFLIDGWLIIEVDGEVKYNDQLQPFDEVIKAERARESRLQNAGYRVLRFRWPDLIDGAFIAEVRRALSQGNRGVVPEK
ncbi:hypothetical protein [Corynebacterium sp. H130]|uniref:hypothetical protein n=1 Tax=Corynebacterium sp. H130 TaxID=3133444 RepID=UPI00309E8E81